MSWNDVDCERLVCGEISGPTPHNRSWPATCLTHRRASTCPTPPGDLPQSGTRAGVKAYLQRDGAPRLLAGLQLGLAVPVRRSFQLTN